MIVGNGGRPVPGPSQTLSQYPFISRPEAQGVEPIATTVV